jgi:hypothetical protein
MRPVVLLFHQSIKRFIDRFWSEQISPKIDKELTDTVSIEWSIASLAVVTFSKTFKVTVVSLNDRIIDHRLESALSFAVKLHDYFLLNV